MGSVENPKEIFGVRLRELRLSRGMSQEALAHEAGLDRTYISSCERGKRNISLENIHRLAKALDVSPAALLESPDSE
ncbi:MAG: helix-turn-helix domain-containing protein [Actinomycetota bacterium]|jgi:transcriptional regulator with XRE-family HTH domain|nr:helix-turn-helix transcriptional regulator [Rubrobacter sp.]MDQ3506814.1 helix-turn-helix domain-containing protein [Actinomycetota bacterium]